MCWVVIDEGSRALNGRFAGSIGLFCLPHETPRMQKTHGWKAMAKVETGYKVVGACSGGGPHSHGSCREVIPKKPRKAAPMLWPKWHSLLNRRRGISGDRWAAPKPNET